jgi:hypothetical protein
MPDAMLAAAFVLMLIAPCAIAVSADRKKKAKKNGDAGRKPKERVSVAVDSGSVPVFTPPAVASAEAISALRARVSRSYTERPDPYEVAASLYAQPSSAYVETYPVMDGRDPAEVLLEQAAAAKAKAAALAEAARAAQAKAHAAAEAANRTARAAALAHKAAEAERDIQAQITAQEQARTASGEHVLPATHPSLDFPRSGRPRRVA